MEKDLVKEVTANNSSENGGNLKVKTAAGVISDNDANKNKLTEAQTEDYKSRYGKIYQIDVTIEPDDETTLEYEFVFKKPQQASFDRYMRSMNNSPMKAARTFINDNIIQEQKDVLEEVTKEYPAMVITINEKLLFALGLGKETNIKKL